MNAMINTIQLKKEQLFKGYFSIGTGPEIALIMGSCRAVAYVTYLRDWNELNGNRFTICYIDPFSWNWDMNENRTDYSAELIKQESNKVLLNMLANCSIFIHEYYANAGMFNCEKSGDKNIYQFGLNPKTDITLPNYNDVFVLTSEIISFDVELKKQAIQDFNVNGTLSAQTIEAVEDKRQSNLERFYEICAKTDFPEFADIFKNKYNDIRMFWTFNHVSAEFTKTLFWLMNNKFLHLDTTGYKITEEDLFANNYTHLTEYDNGYNWKEEVKPLRSTI